MLPKHKRLTTKEVEEVLSRGVSLYISAPKGEKPLISGRFLAKPGIFKVAAVASKAVAKSAVVRNRLRRAVYRAAASLPAPKKQGIAILFVKNVPQKPLTPAFAEEIRRLFAKI